MFRSKQQPPLSEDLIKSLSMLPCQAVLFFQEVGKYFRSLADVSVAFGTCIRRDDYYIGFQILSPGPGGKENLNYGNKFNAGRIL